MRHVAALILALALALPGAALATPQAASTAPGSDGHDDRQTAYVVPEDPMDQSLRWHIEQWLAKWLPIILGQERMDDE